MQPLIKITTEPMRMVRFSQNARLVDAGNVDMERRKALARQSAFRSSAGQHAVSVEDIKTINRVFSKSGAKHQVPEGSAQQVVLQPRQTQVPVSLSTPSAEPVAAEPAVSDTVSEAAALPVSTSASSSGSAGYDFSLESSSFYTAQRGAFEMRVAKGELTYLPPMIMTIITQRPEVHIEYLGGYNYVPPRDGDSGSNVNLFT